MTDVLDLIQDHDFFRGLAGSHLRQLASVATLATYPTDAYVFHEGEPANMFYAIVSGKVALEIHAPTLGPVRIETADPGDVIGWSWLLEPHRWQFDAHVVDHVGALTFPASALRAEADADCAFGYALMARLAQLIGNRLVNTRLRLLDLYGQLGDR